MNIKPNHLNNCFNFLAARGNIQGDHEVIIALMKVFKVCGLKSDSLSNYFDFLIARGDEIKGSNDVVLGLTTAGVKKD